MGSREKPNYGGSGLPFTRKSRPKYQEKEVSYGKIETNEELELYLSGTKISCLICGKEYRSLGNHLIRSHSMDSNEYKNKFNIPVTRSLCCEDLRENKSHIMKNEWKSNDKFKNVRKLLIKNISNLSEGYKHKTKSTVAKRGNIELAKKIQVENDRVKYRKIYLDYIDEAIKNGVTLYTITKSVSQIYKFEKRWPEDKEFSKKLSFVKKPDHMKPGTATEKRICINCGKEFMARKKLSQKTCSKECGYMIRRDRVIKNCVVCGKEMFLTKTMEKRISTCGSDECKKQRRRLMKKS